MSFIRAVIVGTNPLSQVLGGKHPVGFHDGTLAMHPLGFNGIKPGALFGQKQWQDTHPLALALDLLVMLSNPGAYDLTGMPGGIIPDQQPRRFALTLQLGAAPVQKLRRDVAHRTPIHETQRHLVADGSLGWTSLPEDSIAGQGFGIRISLLPALFYQTKRIIAHL